MKRQVRFLKTPAFLVSVFLAIGTFAVYTRAWAGLLGTEWGSEFTSLDDGVYVTQNDHVLDGLTPADVGWAFSSVGYASNWHPLTWLSLQLDSQLFGTAPWGYHLTNVFLHALNSVLLFHFLQRMTGALWRSALVAGLFAWHPLHV